MERDDVEEKRKARQGNVERTVRRNEREEPEVRGGWEVGRRKGGAWWVLGSWDSLVTGLNGPSGLTGLTG